MGGPGRESGRRDNTTAGRLTPRLADDRFYQTLAAAPRRRLLYYLLENDAATVEELASVLSGWEATTSGTMYTPTDRLEIRLQLVHNHLPRLADAGLIHYDPTEGSVRLESLHDRVRDIIEESVEAEQLTDAE